MIPVAGAGRRRRRAVQRKVLKNIMQHELFRRDATVVVAVSGGVDSAVLLETLATLPGFRLRLVVAHLNHMLRGAESDGDEAFVREIAASYGAAVEVSSIDVMAVSRERRLSLEEAGRECRYAFFAEVAEKHGADCVALAHHADDQAETVLMRLLRGSGATGLCAMTPKTADGRYVRPLLHVTRREIEAYAASRRLPFRTDSSNGSTDFLRNRIRLQLIPHLESYNPAVKERLTDTAAALADDEAILERVTDEAFRRHASCLQGRVSFRVEGLAGEPHGLRMRLYRRALLECTGDLMGISYRQMEGIDSLLEGGRPNRRLALAGGMAVARSYGELSFFPSGGECGTGAFELTIDGPGTFPLPGGGELVVGEAVPPDDWRDLPPKTAYFDPSLVPFPWTVRTFRPGDRIVPLGMTGRKKVKELFIDAKVPRGARTCLPLVFSCGRLIWVGGLRVSQESRLSGGLGKAIRAEIRGRNSLVKPSFLW